VGKLNPGIELQIVDEDGNQLPDGERGQIRYRTRVMASEYYKNAEASAKSFRDGWFYPGDLGWLIVGGLYIGGRETEVINLNGVKIDPAVLDEVALELEIYKEAAAFGYRDMRDQSQLAFALVLADESKRKLGEKAIEKAIQAKYKIKNISFNYLPLLPRGETGKVLRAELTDRTENGLRR
jgi:acyl-coenzyme A synthetase/AMP-(fatty) acid ligase